MRLASLAALAAAFLTISAVPGRADAAADVRERLESWADAFNEGRVEEACGLFSRELVSDTRGQGEAGYETRCAVISGVMRDSVRKFRYTPDIKEVIVEGDLAVVRLQWTLTNTPGDEISTESGLDVFRKESDGVWRIIRFIAYDNE